MDEKTTGGEVPRNREARALEGRCLCILKSLGIIIGIVLQRVTVSQVSNLKGWK